MRADPRGEGRRLHGWALAQRGRKEEFFAQATRNCDMAMQKPNPFGPSSGLPDFQPLARGPAALGHAPPQVKSHCDIIRSYETANPGWWRPYDQVRRTAAVGVVSLPGSPLSPFQRKGRAHLRRHPAATDRKSTRLNSSHAN